MRVLDQLEDDGGGDDDDGDDDDDDVMTIANRPVDDEDVMSP